MKKVSNLTALASVLLIALLVIWGGAPARSDQSKDTPASLQSLGDAFVKIADEVTPAVVHISSTQKLVAEKPGPNQIPEDHPFREFFGDDMFKKFFRFPNPHGGRGPLRQGMGSGVLVSPDGLILTNAHVVRGADEIKVKLTDDRSFKAKVIGVDPESDVAVIKVDGKNLPTAKFGDSSKLRVGEIVLAIGNPFGFDKTVTSGIVSALGRTNVGIIKDAKTGRIGYEDFIQTDAAINPGNSGGPLVNIKGQVIGINTAIATRSGGYQGIGFAIPSNSVKAIMDALVKYGKVRRGLLGVNIQDLNESLAKSFGKPDQKGALVSNVIKDSAAEQADIKDGDIIVQMNGTDVENASQLKNMVGRLAPGTVIKLKILRQGKTIAKDVKIGERDSEKLASAAPGEEQPEKASELGIEVEPVPAADRKKLGLKANEGVKVSDVDGSGVGAKMGLRSGDVILEADGKAIKDPASFKSVLKEASKDKTVRLKVQRGEMRIYLAATLD